MFHLSIVVCSYVVRLSGIVNIFFLLHFYIIYSGHKS
jgi:hypothetical protein